LDRRPDADQHVASPYRSTLGSSGAARSRAATKPGNDQLRGTHPRAGCCSRRGGGAASGSLDRPDSLRRNEEKNQSRQPSVMNRCRRRSSAGIFNIVDRTSVLVRRGAEVTSPCRPRPDHRPAPSIWSESLRRQSTQPSRSPLGPQPHRTFSAAQCRRRLLTLQADGYDVTGSTRRTGLRLFA
jgi:hypothetical protein